MLCLLAHETLQLELEQRPSVLEPVGEAQEDVLEAVRPRQLFFSDDLVVKRSPSCRTSSDAPTRWGSGQTELNLLGQDLRVGS